MFMKNSEGTRNMYVHRLVWETFRSSIPNGMTVDHIDRNKTNNNVDNLRLATKTEQQRNKSTTKSGCILQLEFRSTENSVWQSVECPTNFHFAGISEKQIDPLIRWILPHCGDVNEPEDHGFTEKRAWETIE